MRVLVLVLLAITACAGSRPMARSHVWPTLEPDGRIGAVPIDPYAPVAERALHGLVAETITSDVAFGDPGAVTSMVVRVQTRVALPSGPAHEVVAEHGRIQRVTIRVGPGARVSRGERAAALRATSTIDARDPAIRRAARDAISGARTDRQRVAALVSWVYTHISYVHADETVASTVLARTSGDCSEMSLLFVALARAAGIPARRVVGLAGTYVAGASAFGLHAWAEVALDGRWVPVDPTWNEPASDATHIALFVGDGTGWQDALEDLRVAVIDVHRERRLEGRADVRQLAAELPGYLRLRLRR
jgi:Transglutaminase-like superfamily